MLILYILIYLFENYNKIMLQSINIIKYYFFDEV